MFYFIQKTKKKKKEIRKLLQPWVWDQTHIFNSDKYLDFQETTGEVTEMVNFSHSWLIICFGFHSSGLQETSKQLWFGTNWQHFYNQEVWC